MNGSGFLLIALVPCFSSNGAQEVQRDLATLPDSPPGSSEPSELETGARPCLPAELAVARAINRLSRAEEGYRLRHPRHTAHFTDRGLRFEPRSGGPVWQWQLSSVGTSACSLEEIHQGPTSPREEADGSITYPRGAILEQYLPESDAVEQRFVIREPLDTRGEDLVIEGSVACAGEFESTATGWRWSTRAGAVDLGDVFVYDAEGVELAAEMIVQADRTRIVIDSLALAGAAYPVTVDPEIGANDFRISDMGPDGNLTFFAFSPAVAYNSVNHEYLVVWSGSDDTAPLVVGEFEVFGQRIDASTGAAVGTNDFRISDMGPDGSAAFDAEAPAVAYNPSNNEYLVVWAGDDNTAPLLDNEFEIFGQRLDAATGAAVGANDFRISDMGPDGSAAFDAEDPAVAYNSQNNEYLVVWASDDDTAPLIDNEFEIFGQRIQAATGAAVGANDFRISDMGPDGNTAFGPFGPAVAYNSQNNEYLVVWDGDDGTAPLVDNEFEIFGQRIQAATGAAVGVNDFRISDMGPDGNAAFGGFFTAVAYNSQNNEYLVVWEGDDNIAPLVDEEFEIFGQRIQAASGAAVGVNDFRISDMGPDGSIVFGALDADVAYNSQRNEYLVAWVGDDNTLPLVDDEDEVFGQRILASTGAEVGDNDFRLSDMGPDGNPNFAATAPAVAFSSLNNQYLLVWFGDDNVAPLVGNEFEIFGQRFALPALTGFACLEVERLEIRKDDHLRIKLRGALDAGSSFDPRLEDVTFQLVDGRDGDTVSVTFPASSFRLDDPDEFESDSGNKEAEFDVDDFDFEFEAENVAGLAALDGPGITVRLIASTSGTLSEDVPTQIDDDELEFRSRSEPDCSSVQLIGRLSGVAPPLRLDIDPEIAATGQLLRIQAGPGQPGARVVLHLVAVNGEPYHARLTSGVFDSSGNWVLITRVPPLRGQRGLGLTLEAVTAGRQPGSTRTSDTERVYLKPTR